MLVRLGVPLTCDLLLPLVRGRAFPVRRDLRGLAAALALSAVGEGPLSNRSGLESEVVTGLALRDAG